MVPCMISFRGLEAPEWVLTGLKNGKIGAICLFNYNFESVQQLRALNESLAKAAAEGGYPPPIIGIDQEGGQLMAVDQGATELPGNMALGATGQTELARRTGEVLGRELLALGCNMNFAPVLDLATQASNDAMGVRVFSTEPELAAGLGAALIEGMQSVGVLATAKHFPGHGDTELDSHHAAPVITASADLLSQRELVPFKAAFNAGVAAVMTCHAYYPAIDPGNVGTHSSAVLRGLLRDELGFQGIVVTDALDMSGVGNMPGLERARLAVEAGADLAMLGHLPDQAAIVDALASHIDPASQARVMAVRRRLPATLPPLSVVGSEPHRQVAQQSSDAAITAVRGNPRLRSLDRVLVVSVQAGDLTPAETASGGRVALAEQIGQRVPSVTELPLVRGAGAEAIHHVAETVAEWLAAGDGEVVFAAVNAAGDRSQLDLLERLWRIGADPILVALRAPLDVVAASFVPRALCSYGRRLPQTEAVARVLCGEIPALGHLPVTLPDPSPVLS